MDSKIITATTGLEILVDAEDYEELSRFKWGIQSGKHPYPRRYEYTNGKVVMILMHRFLMGPAPGLIVDHVNGNPLDNRKANLRVGTQSQNCRNKRATGGRWKRGAWPSGTGWAAQIRINGKCKHLGIFPTEDEAHAAYLEAAQRVCPGWLPPDLKQPA